MDEFAWGIDIGATKIAIGCVDRLGALIQKTQVPTQAEEGPEAVATQIYRAIESLKVKTSPMIAGVGIAGQVNSDKGILNSGGNLHWVNVPFQSMLSSKLGIKVSLLNDVRAATYGEWLHGAGKNCRDLVCLFLGTGIGGGIVSGGQMLKGSTNSAGELGHMIIDMNGPSCTCENWGCLEAFAGGWAIARKAQKAITANPELGEIILSKVKGEEITAKNVIEAYRDGDDLATQIINEVFEALIAGSVSIVNALNPKKLIFGGGILEGLPEIIEKVNLGVRQRALPSASEFLQVIPSLLGNDSGMIGAAAYALKN